MPQTIALALLVVAAIFAAVDLFEHRSLTALAVLLIAAVLIVGQL